MRHPSLLLAAALLVATAGTSAAEFTRDLLPLMNQRCVMCHLPGAALGGLDLLTDPWAALQGVPSTQSPLALVEPGEPDRSYFYLKLLGTHAAAGGSGTVMPPPQQGTLSPEQLEAFRDWIAAGAARN